MKRLWIILSLWIALVTAMGCATATPDPTSTPLPAVRATPTSAYGEAAPLVSSAVADLASRTGASEEQVEVTTVTPTEFSDASLGVPEAGKNYAQVITPGYVIQLTVDGKRYEYHAAENRIVLASGETTSETSTASSPSAQVTIEQIEVDESGVMVSGSADLPDGTCIETELLADGERQAWWPTDRCAPVRGGKWQIKILLGQDAAPAQLEASTMYEVRAWHQGQAPTSHAFPFELSAPPTPEPSEEITFRQVEIADLGLSLDVPQQWARQEPEWVWISDSNPNLSIGVRWQDIEPPTMPEAAMLPTESLVLDSAQIDLEWGTGRRFVIEVYAPTGQSNDQKAPVESVEEHVLVTIDRENGRRVVDVFATAITVEQLDWLRPILNRALSSATLKQAPQTSTVPDDWQVLHDQTHRYQIRYPADWTFKELDTSRGPEDWPVVRILHFFPQSWAEAMNRSGPPDPSRPAVVAPLGLEVCVGPEEQFRRAYPAPATSQVVELSGMQVTLEQDNLSDELTQYRYVFQDPNNDALRIVLVDHISGFPDRRANNESIVQLIPEIAATLRFSD